MTRPPALLLAAAALALTACTGSSEEREATGPTGPSRPSDCPTAADVREVPPACVEDSEDFNATTGPTGAAPDSSAAIPPVTLAALPGDLARGGNDQDPDKTTETFTVTVPAGSRLRTTAACEGRNTIVVEVEPQSAAEQEFACGFEGAPAELSVEDSVPVKAQTTFTIRVTTTPPSRWFVVVGATDAPPPPDAAAQS